jgi:NAD(P)-dependent dehydrogenase (short-subunit alcohol dehydrogenase family)
MTSLDRFNLKGKVVLLTGGAGLYGRGLTRDLAEAGARLVIAARDLDKLKAVADEENARGLDVTAEQFDQGEESAIFSLRDRILEKFGRIDGLVNNSVARPMKSPDAPVADWAESMRINNTGPFLMHRAFGEVMRARKSGSIVNIGSMQGMVGPSFELYKGTDMLQHPPPDYFVHKAAMLGLTRWYAAYLGPDNVRVNCLSPGGFYNNHNEVFHTRYCERTFLNRMADPTDLGGAVIFLLSDASKYITGTNLPVDGGYSAK